MPASSCDLRNPIILERSEPFEKHGTHFFSLEGIWRDFFWFKAQTRLFFARSKLGLIRRASCALLISSSYFPSPPKPKAGGQIVVGFRHLRLELERLFSRTDAFLEPSRPIM